MTCQTLHVFGLADQLLKRQVILKKSNIGNDLRSPPSVNAVQFVDQLNLPGFRALPANSGPLSRWKRAIDLSDRIKQAWLAVS